MFKGRMASEELSNLTGYSRQTINKWVREKGWATSAVLSVQLTTTQTHPHLQATRRLQHCS